jgi:integrase
VLTTRSGQPVEPRNLVRSFERLVDRAGLRQIRLHDLRHTVATLLKTLRVPQRDAMQIRGHARISVTLEIYTDSDSDSQRDALTRMLDRLFGQAGT